LPIANPANLVIWGIHSPGLGVWLAEFGCAAAASIVITFCGLAISQARLLRCNFACAAAAAKLEPHARMVFCALLASAVALLIAMLTQRPLGYTTLAVAALSIVACHAASLRRPPMFWAEIQPLLQEVSWGVIALVAGLFVLVGAAQQQQLFAGVGWGIGALTAQTGHAGLPIFAALITLASAVINNLPVGLILHNVFQWPSVTALSGFHHVQATALIAVDVGPNLAVSSSLATILWQQALKKYGIEVSAWRFFRLGIVLTPLALGAALFLRFA
jgi:arsenical pump membrane protein